jgi:hypothetical protein
MSKESVHFAALGFEPFRMDPVHFASGFFLSIVGAHYVLETLNKLTVIKHKTGLRDEYAPGNLLNALQSAELIETSVSEAELKLLRTQINGVMANDGTVFAMFKPYKAAPGINYTLVSDRFLTGAPSLDGNSGHFIHQVLEATLDGRTVTAFALACIEHHGSPLEQLVEPLLDADDLRTKWDSPYPQKFGTLSTERLASAAELMERQTAALAQLCRNLERGVSHQTKLRGLVIGLCSWLFIYLQKIAARAKGGEPKRTEHPNDAPRLALTELGLLADPQLFRNLDELDLRLVRNGEVTQLLLNAPPYQFAKIRERVSKYRSAAKCDSILAILDKVEALRRSPTNVQRGTLSLDEAEMLLRPSRDDDEPGPEPKPTDEPEPEDPEPDEEFDRKDLARATADALLFDRQEELEEAAEAMEEALTEALVRDKEEVSGQLTVEDEQRTFSFKLDPGLLKWLNTFCSETAWGGLVKSIEPTLALARANHSAGTFEILAADAVAQPDERAILGMPELLRAWDEDLAGARIPDVGLAQQ